VKGKNSGAFAFNDDWAGVNGDDDPVWVSGWKGRECEPILIILWVNGGDLSEQSPVKVFSPSHQGYIERAEWPVNQWMSYGAFLLSRFCILVLNFHESMGEVAPRLGLDGWPGWGGLAKCKHHTHLSGGRRLESCSWSTLMRGDKRMYHWTLKCFWWIVL